MREDSEGPGRTGRTGGAGEGEREGTQGRSPQTSPPHTVPPPELVAEAAVWVARLHGPGRTRQMERDCLAWQSRSTLHRLAFERCTDHWQEVAGVASRSGARNRASAASAASAVSSPLLERPAVASWAPGAGSLRARRWAMAATAAVALLVAVQGLPLWRAGEGYDTAVGEQRIVMLRDGTRMTLNTATRVRVDLGKTQRTVLVEGGEALFEVAKDASRPFVVRAAGSEVQATGTAFVVRYTPEAAGRQEAVDVTLVEGRVVVRGAGAGSPAAEPVQAVEMVPGERLRVLGRAAVGRRVIETLGPPLDRPRMEQALAWRRGEAVFDDVSLAEAVAEMNRYSAAPISWVGAVGDLRVSGQFRTGDNLNFARAVAALHGLTARERGGGVELVRP